MAKTINFEYKGVAYTLEYTRKSIEALERQGFKLNDIDEKPVTAFPMLFAGAFLAHHKWTKPNVIDEIFKLFDKKDELLMKLAEMYNEPIAEMMGAQEEESEGNLEWGTNW